MSATQGAKGMSPKLERVAELARKDPGLRFQTLVHLLDVDALGRAFARLDGHAAVGVDGVTKEQFGQHLEDNLVALRARMRAAQYRHQPIQRVHIPKASGETRPIGISSVEDKLVQGALCEVLGAIYEQDFLPCSFGFRPGRSAHDALRALNRAVWVDGAQVILEADVQSFFDSVDRKALMEMLRERIVDEPFLRFIGKCLHVGVLDGAEFSTPEDGTVQGSILSPMLGNIYLHHVLDRWFQVEVKPRLGGRAELIRYADDFVIAFHRRADAEWVMGELRQRMARFKLRLHPDKTRLVSFPRPGGGPGGGGNPETFDFLGFTVHWQRGQNRGPSLGFKTRTARLRRALSSVTAYCRSRRHDAVKEQYAGLCRRLEGHMNYFGVNSNIGCIHALVEGARKAWRKWLDRRSQRGRMNWARYEELLVRFPLPLPTIRVRLWA